MAILQSSVSRLPWPGIARRHPVWTTVIFAFVLLTTLGVYGLSLPKAPEYVTDTVKRGDIIRKVEAVGSVISERDLALQFPVSGIVADVFVKEGDSISAGQKLAALRSGTLSADIASAAASLQSAQADLSAMLEGSRPEDIAITEAELLSKQAALSVARTSQASAKRKLRTSEEKLASLTTEASVSLAGDIANAGSTALEHIADAKTGLKAIDDVFDGIIVQDVIQKHNPSTYQDVRQTQRKAADALTSALSIAATATDYSEALSDLSTVRASVAKTADALRQANDFLLSLPITSTFTVSVRQTNSDTLATERASVQSSLSALDSALSNLRDAVAGYATRISAEQSSLASAQAELDRATADIATFEAAVAIAQAQLNLKKAGSRPQDVSAAKARVAEASARLARARASFNDTILTAPIEGRITKVSLKKGETLPTGAAVTMLGNSPYRIEMYIAEVDIPLVELSQSGSIELDAFPGIFDTLSVSEIDEDSTDRDGVPKYRVKLDFLSVRQDLRVGMTGDAEIVTGKKIGVLSVPRRAVIEDDKGDSIIRVLQGSDIEERTVTTGMEGSEGEIEVEGVEEGETVVVLIKE